MDSWTTWTGYYYNITPYYSYDEWGRCDASCGNGQKLSKRFCDNPAPLAGGAKCKGDDIKEEDCEATDMYGKPKKCPRKYLSPKLLAKKQVTFGGLRFHCLLLPIVFDTPTCYVRQFLPYYVRQIYWGHFGTLFYLP